MYTDDGYIKSVLAMKKNKPLTGAQKRKQKRDRKEKEENEKQRELVEGVERLKLGPTPLWKFVVDHPRYFRETRFTFLEIKRIRY
jgi:hypothetical protein